jgi:hypothetical protein
MSSRNAALRRIQQTSSSLLKCLGGPPACSTPLAPLPVDVSLPSPLPITGQLVATGLDERTAVEVSSVFSKYALTTKSKWESKLQETCRAYESMTSSRDEVIVWHERVRAVVARKYLENLEHWTQEAVSRARAHVVTISYRGARVSRRCREKTPFNQVSNVVAR